jgi:hypothetical protein
VLRARALSAAVSAVAIAGCGGHARHHVTPAPAPTPIGDGVSVVVPPGWHLFAPPITALSYPVDRLLLTSYPAARGGNCGPDRAERALPPNGALVYLLEFHRPGPLSRSAFPPRPVHFSLRAGALASYECWHVPSYLLRFRAADRAFQLHVALGPRAGPARRAQVLRVLDSMRFTPPPTRARRSVSARELEHALARNPNDPAVATCRAASAADRRRARSFAHTRHLFVCVISLRNQAPATFDVQLLANHCFVAERRRRGQADYGCVR